MGTSVDARERAVTDAACERRRIGWTRFLTARTGHLHATTVIVTVGAHARRSGKPEEYGEFLHQPGKIYTDFEAIRQEIQTETDRMTGVKAVSSKQIRLTIRSPNVLTMDVGGSSRHHGVAGRRPTRGYRTADS